jgi:hypothetical protein
VELANALLAAIGGAVDPITEPVRQLLTVRQQAGPGLATRFHDRPKTPLIDAALLTNAHGEPSLASELKAELDSADSVDLLCAFVMWRGVRLLDAALAKIALADIPFRVITTTYIGGTEREALDRLARDYGAQVKVQYDAARTRLHAKAWLFRRNTGLGQARYNHDFAVRFNLNPLYIHARSHGGLDRFRDVTLPEGLRATRHIS